MFDKKTQMAWENIKKKAENTNDNYVISVEIGARAEERTRIVENLQNEGLISDVEYIGKDKISCKVCR